MTQILDYPFKSGWHHKALGNSWKVTDDGNWYLPERTLGWQILAWCSVWLLNDQGEPWRFTPEQSRFILWWYAVDERGKHPWQQGVLQRLKGWGKDPLCAALALVELVGPCRFSHFDSVGNPVAVPNPNAYVTVSAVSEGQTRNTGDVLKWMVSPAMSKEYGLKIGAEKVLANGGRNELLFSASSYRSIEGKRPTFSILNETQHWVLGNAGKKMYETLSGNLTKIAGARALAITNAYQPGEDSVAEDTRAAYLDQVEMDSRFPGKRRGPGIYYDSLEADPSAPADDPDAIVEVVSEIRGDSIWLDPEQIVGSFLNRSISISHNLRMFYNQIVAKEDALFNEDEWDQCRYSGDDIELKPGAEIVLGFDGGKTDDATALIAKRVSDGVVFPLMIWEKPPSYVEKGWEIDRSQVDSYVHWAFKTYKVLAFYADVKLWESYIDKWSDTYRSELVIKASPKSPIGWDMRGGGEKITRANESLMTRVFDGSFQHNGNRVLRKHALNARRRENRWGVTFGKESRESPLKVDGYAATILAEMAYRDLLESNKTANRRTPGTLIAY
ncbi:terminase [Brevibacterium moorei]|uniref:terminase n=1 Tax=Brevibacterium moorei TaxID=2968457 RepID=UPI00211C22EF|nr:terminase [Brevibacterium sp. 68QC2CO]MCQ9385126.1 terminase [Brevibacterium sp. 68QC2CO]